MRPNYDVFISYSHKDSDWVRNTLLPKLESHGFSVIIDYRDFRGGSFSVDEMQRAVESSRHTLLVLTDDYINSGWTKFENVMAQSTDPGAVQRKIVPILHKDCKMPLRLSIINYRDFRTETNEAWQLLIRDLM